jgi:menaquinone-dependent protoporphyrinogen IX oxidase
MKNTKIVLIVVLALALGIFNFGCSYAQSCAEKPDNANCTATPTPEARKTEDKAATPVLKTIIIYYSKTGHTLDAARDIAVGMKENNVTPDIKDVKDIKYPELANYDLVLVGSPCHTGTMPFSSGIAGPIKEFLESIPKDFLKGKKAAAFSVHGLSGGKTTVESIEKRLRLAGADIDISPGPVVKAGAFLSLYRGPDYTRLDREKLQAFGKAVTGTSHAPFMEE